MTEPQLRNLLLRRLGGVLDAGSRLLERHGGGCVCCRCQNVATLLGVVGVFGDALAERTEPGNPAARAFWEAEAYSLERRQLVTP